MIFDAALMSLRNLFAPETRTVFWKTLGLTILVLIGLWFGLRESFIAFVMPLLQGLIPDLPDWAGWLTFIFGIFASIGLALGLALLLSPVTAIIAGLFLDDVAEVVEKRDYPNDAPGKAMPIGEAIVASIKFFGIVIIGNLIALMLLFIPGINIIAFFLVNGYLLGREFFEFAAMRFRSAEEAKLLRSRHSGTVFAAGLVIALFLAVPIVNLLTPLFAAGLMVHLHKALTARDPAASLRQG
ncbi:sulfate transporter family protein [Rhizobium sp. AQ_MP]|uniref:sulfate transporter family protein n=1 Tax=Rhizobium sp. AQ_MP TaxID=2761536 RepID=UPI0016396AE3|nr:sulfate transporter family protein [Rhizobium sp. AQ_MP]MBC2772139.1 sulfate transporter family protein [Rhizobium sp. AQ_MP]